jgi:4-hydroxyphenylacetate decarboxylase small subunit
VSANSKHLHCRNYAPVDVVKGICHRTKETLLADDGACPAFDRLPRCGECRLYSPGAEERLGICGASPERPMTYPDLAAVTCEWFAWKDG